jgi:hypothetical protein
VLYFFEKYIIEIRSNDFISINRKTNEQIQKEDKLKITPHYYNQLWSGKWRTFFENQHRKEEFEVFYFPITEEITVFSVTEFKNKSVESVLKEKIGLKYYAELKNIIYGIANVYRALNNSKVEL